VLLDTHKDVKTINTKITSLGQQINGRNISFLFDSWRHINKSMEITTSCTLNPSIEGHIKMGTRKTRILFQCLEMQNTQKRKTKLSDQRFYEDGQTKAWTTPRAMLHLENLE